MLLSGENCKHRPADVEVVVLAFSGYSTDQELILLQQYVPQYDADLIIWQYCLKLIRCITIAIADNHFITNMQSRTPTRGQFNTGMLSQPSNTCQYQITCSGRMLTTQ